MHNCKTPNRHVEASQSWKSTWQGKACFTASFQLKGCGDNLLPTGVETACGVLPPRSLVPRHSLHPNNFWCTVRMFFFNLQCNHALECTASILQTGPLDLRPSRGCQKPLGSKQTARLGGNLSSKNTTATQRQVTDKLWFCRLKDLAGVTETNKIICHFKENNWQLCLPMIKFEHSSKNQKFGKPVSTATSLTVFQ